MVLPRSVLLAACVVCMSACQKSTPANPMGPSIGQVTATLSPVPMPMQVQTVAGSSLVRYQIRGVVTFHDSTGVGGRVTQMTLAVVDGQGQTGNPQVVAIDAVLPAGGVTTQQISHSLDAPGALVPAFLQLSATGIDPTGKTFAVSAVQAALLLAAAPSTGPFSHVFVVVEENRDQADVIGHPDMPYLNSLATQYGLATQYYADTHPSIGNYFMLTVGNIVTNNDSYSGIVSDDNIVRQLVAAGKTWKSYAEDLPAVGYTGGDTGRYARRHNVLALLSDVAGSASQAARLVPFTQFFTDLATGALPNYAFIVPNLCNDGHDCPVATADAWLQMNIAPLVGSLDFQQSGLLIIVYDEATDADTTHGGGRVAWVAVSGRSKRRYRSTMFYQHESTLRLTAQALGLAVFPNRAAFAPDMSEFFIF